MQMCKGRSNKKLTSYFNDESETIIILVVQLKKLKMWESDFKFKLEVKNIEIELSSMSNVEIFPRFFIH